MKVIIYTTCLIFGVALGAPSGSLGVIGGNDVLNHRFPYQVSIQTLLFNVSQHRCGGAIISPNWVITAAHCADVSLLVSRVVAGTFNLSDVDTNPTVQIRLIDLYHVVKHPNYTDGNILNDIALLKMSTPFEFNEFVYPLFITLLPCVAFDEPSIFSGWGLQDPNNNVAEVLQTANLSIITYQDCYNLIHPVYGDNLPLQEETQLCVTGTASPCILDGGGPLVQDNRLIGLLSWLPATCSDDKIPAIFTSTGYFKKFIKQYVDDLPSI